MDLSAADIAHMSFNLRSDQGFDPDQVRAFQAEVARRITALEQTAQMAGVAAAEARREANEMRLAATELVAEAEALFAEIKVREQALGTNGAPDRGEAHAAATEIIAQATADARLVAKAAEAHRQTVEADIEARIAVSKTEAKQVVDDSRAEAQRVIEAAARESGRLIGSAREDATIVSLASVASAEHEAAQVRTEAAQVLELARAEAAAIVERARVEFSAHELNEHEVIARRSRVDDIVTQAEGLLEEARAEAGRIIAEATNKAQNLVTPQALSDEVRRSVHALRAVADNRIEITSGAETTDALPAVRARAVRVLSEIRRTDGRLQPEKRAELLEELIEVQELVRRIEARLVRRDDGEQDQDHLVVDIRDEAPVVEPPQRQSRYQLRSANLPKIGSDVADVSRAIRSLRDQLPDLD